MEAAGANAAGQLEQCRVELPAREEIKGYVVDFREFLSLVSAAIRYNRSHEFQPTAHSDVD